MVRLLLGLCVLVCCVSCERVGYHYSAQKAQDFVVDSYKIREGKFSILEMEGRPVATLSPELLEEYQDVIHDDDILELAIYHPSRRDIVEAVSAISKSMGYRVTEGQIVVPDLGLVEVDGLTLEQARVKIQNEYLKQIRDIDVFIAYKTRLAKKVELTGMVSVPEIPVTGKLRLYAVLAQARVPTQANLFMSYVIRDGHLLPVDLYKLMHEGDVSQNVVMRAGDKVFIADPASATVMVMGEVGAPQALPLHHGYMSLREALVMAGGIPYTGDKSVIQVIRGNILRPKVYTLNWEQILHLPNDSLLLMPGDTVYIAAKPITEWNRFIEQLLPSFGGVQVINATGKIIGKTQ